MRWHTTIGCQWVIPRVPTLSSGPPPKDILLARIATRTVKRSPGGTTRLTLAKGAPPQARQLLPGSRLRGLRRRRGSVRLRTVRVETCPVDRGRRALTLLSELREADNRLREGPIPQGRGHLLREIRKSHRFPLEVLCVLLRQVPLPRVRRRRVASVRRHLREETRRESRATLPRKVRVPSGPLLLRRKARFLVGISVGTAASSDRNVTTSTSIHRPRIAADETATARKSKVQRQPSRILLPPPRLIPTWMKAPMLWKNGIKKGAPQLSIWMLSLEGNLLRNPSEGNLPRCI